MNLQVEKTIRARNDHNPFDFMPPKIPGGSVVMVFWDSYGNKKSVNSKAATELLEQTLEELRIQELESEGLTRSDAQGVYDAERIKNG